MTLGFQETVTYESIGDSGPKKLELDSGQVEVGDLGQESEHQVRPQRNKGKWDPGQLLRWFLTIPWA